MAKRGEIEMQEFLLRGVKKSPLRLSPKSKSPPSIPPKGGSHVIGIFALSPFGGVRGGFFYPFWGIEEGFILMFFNMFCEILHSSFFILHFNSYLCPVYACSGTQRQLTLWENIAFAVILLSQLKLRTFQVYTIRIRWQMPALAQVHLDSLYIRVS